MKRLVAGALVGVFSASALLVATPALATGQGQVEGGNIYRIKNVTQNIDFNDPQTANKCEVVQYRVRIHNPGPGVISNVNVKATLPATVATTNTSTVTISASNAFPQTTSDSALLNLSSATSVTYMGSSTELLDANGSLIKALPDGIIGSGVNIGNVGVSINEKRFVQFKAKTGCPEVPKPSYKCEALGVVKLSANKFEFTATATVTNTTVKSFVFTTKDSTGKVVSTKTVTTSATSAKYVFESSVAGTYTTTAVVQTADGDATSSNCVKSVTIEAVVPPVTPPTEPELPNTGPGSVVGVVAGTSAIATALHYGMAMRRSRRDEI